MTETSNASPAEGTNASRQAATLEFRETTKRYPGQDEPAVDKLSLEVPAGEICVFVGPSGCGKTTAMRMVNRMIDITEGDILLDGASVRDRKSSDLRREIGYAIQQIGLFPHLSIADNIGTVPRLLGWDKKRIAARVDELLELVSLDPHETRDRYPAQLSGGQRQRVGVARALAVDPPLMLMDEPFGAIDPINRERLQNEFLRLQQEIRKTIVFVTHDIDEAIKMGDKIAVLQKGGKLAQFATPAELLMYPASKFVEDFVGADRALKRLALQRVKDIDLWKVAQVRLGESVTEAQRKIDDADVKTHVLVVDDRQRPLGWVSVTEIGGDRVRDDRMTDAGIVEMDDILRDALADVLTRDARYGVVTDHQGKIAGVLSIEVISHFLHDASPESARSGADLVEDEPDLVEEQA